MLLAIFPTLFCLFVFFLFGREGGYILCTVHNFLCGRICWGKVLNIAASACLSVFATPRALCTVHRVSGCELRREGGGGGGGGDRA